MRHNTDNFGQLIAERHFKASASFWFRFGGAVALGLIVFAGIYLIFDPIVDSDTPTLGLIVLGVAIALIGFMIIMSKRIKRSVAIYEQGVVVIKGEQNFPFHYSQIKGLYDSSIGGIVFMGGGLIGAVVSGVATAVASKAIEAIDREFRNRDIDIEPLPETGLERIGVVTTGGDLLSHVYTMWVIKEKGITKENLHQQELNFGDVELKSGVFIHTRLSGDKVHARLQDVVGMDIEDDKLRLLGTNQVGKQVVLISLGTVFTLNWDLLAYVIRACSHYRQ